MEALELKERRKQIQAAIVYTLMSIVLIAYGWLFLADQYSFLFQEGDAVSSVYKKIEATKQNGLSPDDLRTVLMRVVKNNDTVNAFYKDKDKLTDAIKKPAGVTLSYDEWLLSEAGKKTQLDEEIAHNGEIIGNILPVFSQVDVTSEDFSDINSLVSFKTFIDYVEINLLRAHQLESYSPVGLGNIDFEKEKSKIVSDIASFKLPLEVKGTNRNIKSFLTDIQASGKLIIQDGKLVSPVNIHDNGKFSGLANLLMTIDDVKFTDSPNNGDSLQNNAAVTLRFYVRSLGSQELIVLRSRLVTKYNDINKNIALYSDCKRLGKIGDTVCADTNGSRSIGAIRSLQRDMEALKPQFDSLKSNKTNGDVSSDLEKAFSFNASLGTIDKILQENLVVINKLATVGTK